MVATDEAAKRAEAAYEKAVQIIRQCGSEERISAIDSLGGRLADVNDPWHAAMVQAELLAGLAEIVADIEGRIPPPTVP